VISLQFYLEYRDGYDYAALSSILRDAGLMLPFKEYPFHKELEIGQIFTVNINGYFVKVKVIKLLEITLRVKTEEAIGPLYTYRVELQDT